MAAWCQVEAFSITVTFLAVNSFSFLSTLFSAVTGHWGGQIKQLKCSRASWLHLIITSAAAPVIHPSDTLQSATIAAINQGKTDPTRPWELPPGCHKQHHDLSTQLIPPCSPYPSSTPATGTEGSNWVLLAGGDHSEWERKLLPIHRRGAVDGEGWNAAQVTFLHPEASSCEILLPSEVW